MKKIMMLGAAILALQALPALAQDGGPAPEGKPPMHHGPGKFFDKLDADKDGSVTEQEFLDVHKKKFAEMDANKDGKITKDEMESRRAAMKKRWEERKAEIEAKRAAEKPADAPAEKPADAPVEKPAEAPKTE